MATTDDGFAARNTARALVERLAAIPAVEAVELLAPTAGQFDEWSIEATVDDAGIPPAVCGEIHQAGAQLRPMPPQAGYQVFVAVL